MGDRLRDSMAPVSYTHLEGCAQHRALNRYEEGMKEFALLHDLAVGDGGEVDGPERHHAGVGRRLIR